MQAALELASAHAETCRILSDLRRQAVQPQTRISIEASWEQSHAAYLFALELAGQPLVSLPRSWAAATSPELTQSHLIDPAYSSEAVAPPNYIRMTALALRQTAVRLRRWLQLGHVGFGIMFALLAWAITVRQPTPHNAAHVASACVGVALKIAGREHAAAWVLCIGACLSEIIGAARAATKSVQVRSFTGVRMGSGGRCWSLPLAGPSFDFSLILDDFPNGQVLQMQVSNIGFGPSQSLPTAMMMTVYFIGGDGFGTRTTPASAECRSAYIHI